MKKISLRTRLLIMVIAPIVLIAGFITLFAIQKTEEGMKQEMTIGLKGIATSVNAAYQGFAEGDYELKDGVLMKGDFNVTDSNEILDAIVEGTDYDVTIFYGKTRMATTLKSVENGERIIGTDANNKVVEAVLNKGQEYVDYATEINGENYYVYYMPIKDSSGKIVGMVFAGIPSSDAETYTHKVARTIGAAAGIPELIVIIVAVVSVLGIVRAIKSAENAIDILAEGNLDISLDDRYLQRGDEIGNMLRALQGLSEKLREMVHRMHQSSQVLIESGKKLEEMAHVTSKTTEEINNAVGDISKGAVTQAEEIENANIHIVNIGEIIENIVKSVA